MRLSSMSGNSFITYLKKHKDVTLLLAALIVGLALLLVGSGREAEVEEDGTTLEERLADICSSVEGVGRCRVMVYYADGSDNGEESVESVVVVCDGADSIEVRRCLTETLSSLFGIGTNRIRIEKLADGK